MCCGSAMFLKNRYGNGYILTVDKKKMNQALLVSLNHSSNFNFKFFKMIWGKIIEFYFNCIELAIQQAHAKGVEFILQFIASKIKGAFISRSVNNQISFILPYSQKIKFEEFFLALDENKDILGIESYGISDTTLEEVCLKLIYN